MKVINICPNCKGSGRVPFLQFFSRSCFQCSGRGKTTKHIKDMKKGTGTFS